MAYYYPRFSLDFTVPVGGTKPQRRIQAGDDTVVRWTMPVRRFRWEKNDYAMADVLEVTVDWSVAGIDPRLIEAGTGEFSIGQRSTSDPNSTWTPGPGELRFAGILQKPSRHWSREAREGRLLFHDYTSIFLTEKPFVSKGIPDYSQTLSGAWARICDHVGPTDPDNNNEIASVVGKHLRNNILFLGDATDARLGDSVGARFHKDRIGASGPTDAWAVWQQCIQMCGLISYIELDHLVITTATDYYTSQNPGRLILGHNISELEEERDIPRSRSGVIVYSFDPTTGAVIEAFSPPLGDSSVRKKHLGGKKKKTEDQIEKGESREVFNYPGISDPGRLQAIADRVQIERSVQELSGRVATAEMTLPAANDVVTPGINEDGTFDLLTLSAGDVISVEIDPEHLLDQVLNVNGTWGTGTEARVAFLMSHGYQEGPARVLVANLSGYAKLGSKFFVKSVVTECDASTNPGSYKTEVFYCNRINITGDALGDPVGETVGGLPQLPP
jgi:hypothetical protein